jgi:hypothetical protein
LKTTIHQSPDPDPEGDGWMGFKSAWQRAEEESRRAGELPGLRPWPDSALSLSRVARLLRELGEWERENLERLLRKAPRYPPWCGSMGWRMGPAGALEPGRLRLLDAAVPDRAEKARPKCRVCLDARKIWDYMNHRQRVFACPECAGGAWPEDGEKIFWNNSGKAIDRQPAM